MTGTSGMQQQQKKSTQDGANYLAGTSLRAF